MPGALVASGPLALGLSSTLLLSASSVVVGILIGAVGIGGVLLVPALIYFTPLDVHQSMATALLSFIATGIVGTWAYLRRGSIDWGFTLPLCAGALVCSFLGAAVNAGLSAATLMTILAVLIIAAGLYTIVSMRGAQQPPFAGRPRARSLLLLFLGGVAGFSSGLTGTGGPLVAVPLMIMCGFPPLTSIGASQVLQILAAGSGTVGNLMYGSIVYSILPVIVLFEVIGVWIGAKIIHAVDAAAARKLVAWLCLLIGAWMLVRESTM